MTNMWDALADGSPRALATVVRQLRSAPRDAGTMMAVGSDGSALGNVSAGCIDAEVYELAGRVLDSGRAELATFGVSDERAWGAGLSCGGAVEVVVRRAPADHLASLLAEGVRDDVPVALVTALGPAAVLGRHVVVTEEATHGAEDDPALAAAARSAAATAREDPAAADAAAVTTGEYRFLVQWQLPRPLLLVFGAVAFAESVAAIGRLLGYRVVVCDARPVFATADRVPSADAVVLDWPHRFFATAPVDHRTVVVSLLHDEKFETPLLDAALRSPASYVGALGSRGTQQRRRAALRDVGLAEDQLDRLHGPAGLDLGARTSEETAMSILAEVVATANGRTGRPLSLVDGRIHRPTRR